jgi:hypothetical protein
LSDFVEEGVIEMRVIWDLMDFLESLSETVCFILGGTKCLMVLVYEMVVRMFFLSGNLLEAGPEALTVAVVKRPTSVDPLILAVFVQVPSYLSVKFVEDCF